MSDNLGFLLFLWIVGAPAIGLVIDAYVYGSHRRPSRREQADSTPSMRSPTA